MTSNLIKNSATLVIPNDTFWIRHGLSWIESVLTQVGLNEIDNQKFQMAIEETIVNAIKHAYNVNEVGQINIVCSIDTLGVEISVKDKGVPFDPSLIDFNEETFDGFGSYMLGKLVDKVAYNNLGTEGKEIVLTKYIDHINYDELLRNIELANKEKNEETISNENNFEFCLASPQDAIEISKCAYEAYGYTYAYEHIYFPDRIRKLQESGDLCSIVCKTSTGEIAGHIGIIKSDFGPHVCEVGILMTKQKFRGKGLANKLLEHAIKEAEQRNITTLFAQCVLAHLFSQLSFIKYDFVPSALLPAYVPEHVAFKNIDENVEKQRSGILLTCKILQPPVHPIYTFYLPSSLRDFADIVLNGQGVKYEWSDIASLEISDNCSISNSINLGFKMGKIIVHQYGKNFDTEINKNIIQAKKQKIQMIEVFLDIQNKDAIPAADTLEKYGFIFTGIVPANEQGHFAIFQLLNGISHNMEDMKLIPEGEFFRENLITKY